MGYSDIMVMCIIYLFVGVFVVVVKVIGGVDVIVNFGLVLLLVSFILLGLFVILVFVVIVMGILMGMIVVIVFVVLGIV